MVKQSPPTQAQKGESCVKTDRVHFHVGTI